MNHPGVNKDFVLNTITETELCDTIMNKFFLSGENKIDIGIDANSLLLYLSSHGLEKEIITTDDFKPNTVIDYITSIYNLDSKEQISINTYIRNNIKFTSSVPSDNYGAVGERCPAYGGKSTREWDIFVIDLYMKKMLKLKNNSEIKNEELSHLFLIIRYRLRKLFRSLHLFLDDVDIPEGTSYTLQKFYRDTHKFATHNLNKIWNDYKANPYVNNKSFSFKPNPGEGNLNAEYGIHILGAFSNGKSTISESFNTVDVDINDFYNRIIKPTFFQRIFGQFITNSIQKKQVDKIVATLQIRKSLTLGDIFYLGWILGKKLYIFDPSCNAYHNETGTTTRSGIRLEHSIPDRYIHPVTADENVHNSPENTQLDPDWILGGKKKRHITKRRKNKKRRKSIRRKRGPH